MGLEVGDEVVIHSPDGAVEEFLNLDLKWRELSTGKLVRKSAKSEWVVCFGVHTAGLHRCGGILRSATGQFIKEEFLRPASEELEWD